MFIIKDTLVSLDLVEHFFKCNLAVCKGQCCIDGDAGAPLLPKEKEAIDANLDKILPLLPEKSAMVVAEEGSSYIDSEGDLVTMLVDGANCAFSIIDENGVCLCALEKGYREGVLPMLKPSSCHLYPVRLKEFNGVTAVNLHRWKICKCAEKKGKETDTRAYEFLEEPLKRKFGKEWYEELKLTAEEWNRQNSHK